MSLCIIGTPCSGPVHAFSRSARSAARADCSAASRSSQIVAFRSPLTASMVRQHASSNSSDVASPFRTASAASTSDRSARSVIAVTPSLRAGPLQSSPARPRTPACRAAPRRRGSSKSAQPPCAAPDRWAPQSRAIAKLLPLPRLQSRPCSISPPLCATLCQGYGPNDMSDSAAVFETDVPARLDRLPFTRFHWLVIIALGIAWVLDGLEVTIVGSLSGALTESPVLRLTGAEVGLAASAYLIGAVSGALFFGWLTDRLGRKKLFSITVLLYLV